MAGRVSGTIAVLESLLRAHRFRRLNLRNHLIERFERADATADAAGAARPDTTRVELRVEREQITQARQLVESARRMPLS